METFTLPPDIDPANKAAIKAAVFNEWDNSSNEVTPSSSDHEWTLVEAKKKKSESSSSEAPRRPRYRRPCSKKENEKTAAPHQHNHQPCKNGNINKKPADTPTETANKDFAPEKSFGNTNDKKDTPKRHSRGRGRGRERTTTAEISDIKEATPSEASSKASQATSEDASETLKKPSREAEATITKKATPEKAASEKPSIETTSLKASGNSPEVTKIDHFEPPEAAPVFVGGDEGNKNGKKVN
jgi:hypothetical protein